MELGSNLDRKNIFYFQIAKKKKKNTLTLILITYPDEILTL